MKIFFLAMMIITTTVHAQWIDFSSKNGQQIKASELAQNFDYLKKNTDKARIDASVHNQDPVYGYKGSGNLAILVFNNEQKDDTGIYNESSGVITANREMTLLIDLSLWGESNAISGVAYVEAEVSKDNGSTWNQRVTGKVCYNAADRVGAELHTQIDLEQGDQLRFVLYNTASNKRLFDANIQHNVLRVSEL